MPTTTVKSIGSAGGRDYSSIQAWEDACPANLVTNDEIWKGELYNDSEFLQNTQVTISGTTTDATRYQWLTTGAGQSFKDHADKTTNPLYYDQAKGVGIKCTHTGYTMSSIIRGVSASYFRLSNIQLWNSGTGNGAPGSDVVLGNYSTIENCIFRNSRTNGASSSGVIGTTSGNQNGITVTNCDFVINGGEYAFFADREFDVMSFRNCTFVNTAGSGTCFRFNYGQSGITVKNCYVGGFTTILSGAGVTQFNAASNYNSTSLASAPGNWGANSQTSKSVASQFESATVDFRVKAGADLINAGTRDQTFTNDLDIIGQTRSTTTPTIGAWEYQSSAPATPLFARAFGPDAQRMNTGLRM